MVPGCLASEQTQYHLQLIKVANLAIISSIFQLTRQALASLVAKDVYDQYCLDLLLDNVASLLSSFYG